MFVSHNTDIFYLTPLLRLDLSVIKNNKKSEVIQLPEDLVVVSFFEVHLRMSGEKEWWKYSVQYTGKMERRRSRECCNKSRHDNTQRQGVFVWSHTHHESRYTDTTTSISLSMRSTLSGKERVTYCTMYTYSVVLESFGLPLSIWSKQVWKNLNFHFGSVTTSCSQSSFKCTTTSKSSFQKKRSS